MVDAVFGAEGALARALPGYEVRSGQLAMARAVEEAVALKRHLAVEAPCGIGKTFAYLVPAIRHALATDTRVIVCTANIALQEQIVSKDLPALQTLLGTPFSYALIKGINNYFCRDRYEEAAREIPTLPFGRDELQEFRRVGAWAEETSSGDLSDLDFAHVRVKSFGAGDVILPPASTVICDEAHAMADIARDFFGARLTPFSITALVRGANWFKRGGLAEQLRTASRDFFARVRDVAGRRLRPGGWIDAGPLQQSLGAFLAFLKETRDRLPEEDEEAHDKLGKFASAAENYVGILQDFLEARDPNRVYWIEKDDRSARLHSRVIDVSGLLEEQLFKTTQTVVLTSATLTAAGDFGFVRRETGARDVEELRVESPFDFRTQAALVVPKMRSAPNDAGFAPEMSGHINRILRFLGGRTMCLFTSYRNLEACADAAEETGVRILRQGEMPRSKLLDRFRREEGTALFATASFWQGVDIPGEALSCLVIDKIPFMSPGDPLLEAIQERDPGCFSSYSLPKATLDLRQGFGRLIRTRTDRGVVVIFDNRLFTKAYGAQVLASLPDCPVHRDLDALEAFFRDRGEVGGP